MNFRIRMVTSSRQRTLPLPAPSDALPLWNTLPEQHQQACRQTLHQLLLTVAHAERDARRESLNELPSCSQE